MLWQKSFDGVVNQLRDRDISLRIQLWNGTRVDLADTPRVALKVPDLAGIRYFLNPTLDSLGHAYVEGKIDVEGRATDVIDIATQLAAGSGENQEKRGKPKRSLHSRKIDKESITYHYDVSNEFYRLWLDSEMVYSCGYFHHENDSLEAAQLQKIDLILNKLNVRSGDHLLDIGCGWGSLIIRAAKKYGAKAVGVTLSRNQYELAQERIAAAGLTDRCEVRLEDYRDVRGKFDRIASVGMFEHVGLKNLRPYFNKINELLKDNGTVLNHGITSSDPDSCQSPLGGGAFIDQYVFPNGELPHLSLALREMSAAGLEAVDMESLRRHYVMTLNHWTRRFEENSEQLRALAGDKRWRIWRVYLAGCAHGFAQHWISVYQILAVKSGASVLPLTREYLK